MVAFASFGVLWAEAARSTEMADAPVSEDTPMVQFEEPTPRGVDGPGADFHEIEIPAERWPLEMPWAPGSPARWGFGRGSLTSYGLVSTRFWELLSDMQPGAVPFARARLDTRDGRERGGAYRMRRQVRSVGASIRDASEPAAADGPTHPKPERVRSTAARKGKSVGHVGTTGYRRAPMRERAVAGPHPWRPDMFGCARRSDASGRFVRAMERRGTSPFKMTRQPFQ